MSFYIHRTSGGKIVALCFDVPTSFEEGVRAQLQLCRQTARTPDLKCIIFRQLVELYDRAIWSIRDAVRDHEKVNVELSFEEKPNV